MQEVKASVVRVLLLQVSGQGRGLQIFYNSLTMETLCAVFQRP
jgi:hypothetical protein